MKFNLGDCDLGGLGQEDFNLGDFDLIPTFEVMINFAGMIFVYFILSC